jgi:hypothetical protein
MSGRRLILFGVARAMISDDAIVSGLVLALLGDAHVWRKSGGLVVAVMLLGSSIRNHGSRCDCWRVLDVKRKGKELRRWGIWNSRNREDRDPGRLA